jgi:UDPglucose 6-dehydrogenase
MGLDPRIGQFYFRAGLGYGGPCLEKDLAALMAIGEQAKVPLTISQAAQNVNRSQRFWPLQQLQHLYGSGNPLKLMIWGLAYVANGCDLRQSPALETIQILLDAGYERPFFYDPYVSFAAFKAVIPLAEQNQWLDDEQALWHHLPEVDAVLILTGHTIFQSFDLERLDRLMAGRWVIDACGLWEKEEVGVYRFGYAAIGRPPAFPR